MSNSKLSVPFVLPFLSLVVLQYFSLSQCGKIAERIVGGTLTTVEERKYLVYLRYNGQFFCGGTLVSLRHVVTAEHCVVEKQAPEITVVGGTSFLSSGGVGRIGERIFHSPNFSATLMDMDVAVIQLKSDMEGPNIQAIKICSQPVIVGENIVVSGWGKLNENDDYVPDQMRTVNVPIVAKSECIQQYADTVALTGHTFCASQPGTRDSCSGDSGGPAIFRGELCGIVSFGVGCANAKYPGVYAAVFVLRDFIINAMNS